MCAILFTGACGACSAPVDNSDIPYDPIEFFRRIEANDVFAVQNLLQRGMSPDLRYVLDTSKLQGVSDPQIAALIFVQSPVQSGDTALIAAARSGNVGVIEVLLDHGADIHLTNPRIEDGQFKTATWHARSKGNTAIERRLREVGGFAYQQKPVGQAIKTLVWFIDVLDSEEVAHAISEMEKDSITWRLPGNSPYSRIEVTGVDREFVAYFPMTMSLEAARGALLRTGVVDDSAQFEALVPISGTR